MTTLSGFHCIGTKSIEAHKLLFTVIIKNIFIKQNNVVSEILLTQQQIGPQKKENKEEEESSSRECQKIDMKKSSEQKTLTFRFFFAE